MPVSSISPSLRQVCALGHERQSACTACAVRDIAICTSLTGADQAKLRDMATIRHFAPGEIILAAEESPALLGTIVKGTVKAYKLMTDGRQQVVGFLFPGDFLGSITAAAQRSFAEAIVPVELCVFPPPAFQRLAREAPQLERRLLEMATADLDLAQEWMLLLGRKTAQERVATFLMLLIDKADRRGFADCPIALPMNRSEIADYLGLTIETVSRQLSKLKNAGIVDIRNAHEIGILDRPRLATLAAGEA